MKEAFKIAAIVLITPPVLVFYVIAMAAFINWCNLFFRITP